MLLDESGEAYLADFGLTKQVGGASTETGQLVGTLDYLAPEQIRGEEVDGRTDEYALACVLYECLAGHAALPPLRRKPSFCGRTCRSLRPRLPPIRASTPSSPAALAKEKKDRYESPAAFCEAAAQALGLETPRLRRRRRLLRRSRLLVAAGVLVLAGAAVAVGVEVTTRTSSPNSDRQCRRGGRGGRRPSQLLHRDGRRLRATSWSGTGASGC